MTRGQTGSVLSRSRRHGFFGSYWPVDEKPSICLMGTRNHQRRLDDLTDPQVWHSRWRKLKPLVRLPGRLSVRTLRIRGFWACSEWMLGAQGLDPWLASKRFGSLSWYTWKWLCFTEASSNRWGNPKKIFASRISVVFLVGSRGSVAESCAAFRSLCSGVRPLNVDTSLLCRTN